MNITDYVTVILTKFASRIKFSDFQPEDIRPNVPLAKNFCLEKLSQKTKWIKSKDFKQSNHFPSILHTDNIGIEIEVFKSAEVAEQ